MGTLVTMTRLWEKVTGGNVVTSALVVEECGPMDHATAPAQKSQPAADRTVYTPDVFAAETTASSPSWQTGTMRLDLTNLTASLRARRNPVIIVVGCIPLLTSSVPRFSSSAATMTTDVVPSPTSLS